MTDQVAVGIDSGASKTDVIVSTVDETRSRIIPGGVNFQRLGMDETVRRLTDVFAEIGEWIPDGATLSVCIGLAGADDAQDRELIESALRVNLSRTRSAEAPKGRLRVVQDSVVALEAAFPGESGVVIVVGTGSIVVGRCRDGSISRTGGWGYLLGDEGSGHAIGLAALRWVARSLDGDEVSPFGKAIMDSLSASGRSDLIHSVYRESGVVQTVAPVVIDWYDRGDSAAAKILGDGAAGIAACFGRLLDKVSCEIEHRYVLTGGLSGSSAYRSLIGGAIEEVAEGWGLVDPAFERPAHGALAVARSMQRQ